MPLLSRLILFVALGVFFALSGIACSELSDFDQRSINRELADSLLGVTNSTQIQVDIIVDGYVRVRAESPVARTVETEFASYTRFKGPPVFVTVFDSLGTIETTVRSHELVYRSYASVFEFEGDVFVQTNQNRTLRSEQLEWNEARATISSPGFVIITSPTDSITGYGFVGDEDLIRYTLSQVTGEFSID